MIITSDTLKRLLFDLCLSDDVAAVGAAVICRHSGDFMAYSIRPSQDKNNPIMRRILSRSTGLDEAYVSFSCMLVDLWKLEGMKVPPNLNGYCGSDWAFCDWVNQKGFRTLVDWGLRPIHLNEDGKPAEIVRK